MPKIRNSRESHGMHMLVKTGALCGDGEIKHHMEVMFLVPVKPVVTFLMRFPPNSKCFTHAKNEYTCKFKGLIFACHLSIFV